MAKDQIVASPPFGRRAPQARPSGDEAPPNRNSFGQIIRNLPQFLREVRQEARKVTWTSWKETWITSVMVGIMVILTAFFFFGVDALLHGVVGALLKLANAG